MCREARQHLGGLVVNSHPNLARPASNTLKAVLTNCVRHGPASQNRERLVDFQAHLPGTVTQAVMVNAVRVDKLNRIFDRIVGDLRPYAWHMEPCVHRDVDYYSRFRQAIVFASPTLAP